MLYDSAFVRVFNGNPDIGNKFVGTAFFINKKILLTAKHVVDECSKGVFLRLPPHGVTCSISNQNITRYKRDIASLTLLNPCEHACIIPVTEKPLSELSDVIQCGFYDAASPLHKRKSNVSNHLVSINTWVLSDGNKIGMSGGAVIHDDELVAVIQARDEESKIIAYCIPFNEILDDIKPFISTKEVSVNNKYRSVLKELNEFKELTPNSVDVMQKKIMSKWLTERLG